MWCRSGDQHHNALHPSTLAVWRVHVPPQVAWVTSGITHVSTVQRRLTAQRQCRSLPLPPELMESLRECSDVSELSAALARAYRTCETAARSLQTARTRPRTPKGPPSSCPDVCAGEEEVGWGMEVSPERGPAARSLGQDARATHGLEAHATFDVRRTLGQDPRDPESGWRKSERAS